MTYLLSHRASPCHCSCDKSAATELEHERDVIFWLDWLGLWKGNSKFGSDTPTSVCLSGWLCRYALRWRRGTEVECRLSEDVSPCSLGGICFCLVVWVFFVLLCFGVCCLFLLLTREFFAVVRIRCPSYGSRHCHSPCIGLLWMQGWLLSSCLVVFLTPILGLPVSAEIRRSRRDKKNHLVPVPVDASTEVRPNPSMHWRRWINSNEKVPWSRFLLILSL